MAASSEFLASCLGDWEDFKKDKVHYVFNHKTAGDDVLLLYVGENIDPANWMGEPFGQERKLQVTAEDYRRRTHLKGIAARPMGLKRRRKLVATDLKHNNAVPKDNVEDKETDEEKGQIDKGNGKQEEAKQKCDFVAIQGCCQNCGML